MDKLLVSPSPHIHSDESTAGLMRDVIIALIPVTAVSFLYYGWKDLLLTLVTIVSCLAFEWLICRFLFKKENLFSGWSAAVTGLLLALNLPTSIPLWIAVVGSLFAIGVVKMTFGGLGQNVFNPAIAARVFLLISFPVAMTDWSFVPVGPLSSVDAVSGATLLSRLNEGGVISMEQAQYINTLFLNIGGSAGEISTLALLVGFIYLLVRRVIRPYITLSIWASVAVFTAVFHLIDPVTYTGPVFNLLTGGLMLGSIFMATDYVTSPMSDKGGIIYGCGIGLITMLIRWFGAYPEGVSFAILIMNAFVPLINKLCHQKKYGRA